MKNVNANELAETEQLTDLANNSQLARQMEEDFVVLNDEQADDLFGGKFICVVVGSNNGNC